MDQRNKRVHRVQTALDPGSVLTHVAIGVGRNSTQQHQSIDSIYAEAYRQHMVVTGSNFIALDVT